jgi:hypothetical protein
MESQKRQVDDDDDNSVSSDDSQKCLSQKRHRKKKKQATPVESVNNSSSDSPEPEVIDDSITEGTGQSVEARVVFCKVYTPANGLWQRGDLDEQHQAAIGEHLTAKGDSTKDLDLMFSKKVSVNFRRGGKATLEKGRWCFTCK